MDRGDIYWVSLNPTSGHEQEGSRPVLIISKASFNRLTQVPIVLPITSGGNFARIAGLTVSLMGAGTETVGIVRCDQLRALDLHSRKARKIETLEDELMEEILGKVSALFDV
jgi:mRNA interferase ChpB